ncbi:hypothetical protein KIN20_030940, partial [Parelaphostrongylus tenuis]
VCFLICQLMLSRLLQDELPPEQQVLKSVSISQEPFCIRENCEMMPSHWSLA